MTAVMFIAKPSFFDPTKKIGRLRRAVYERLMEHQAAGQVPTSARFLYYELVQAGVVSKQATGKRRADQDLGDALFDLREAGMVPWADIVDETRSLVVPFVGGSVREWVQGALSSSEPMLDPWLPGRRPLVVTESRSLAGVLRAILYEYSVAFAATNGQVGGFLRTDIVPALTAGDRVLYLGDYDLAGVLHIEANTRRVLEHEVGALAWERLALTQEQIQAHNLVPIIKRDRRYKDDGGLHQAYETEALSQGVIVGIVRQRLDDLLPQPLKDVLERRRVEVEALKEVLA